MSLSRMLVAVIAPGLDAVTLRRLSARRRLRRPRLPRPGEESDALQEELLGNRVDRIMTVYPTRLERDLRDLQIVRPSRLGIDPCV
jgi:hypothetical protein